MSRANVRVRTSWWLALILPIALAIAPARGASDAVAPVKIGILPFLDASGSMSADTAAAIGRLVQAEMSHSAPNLSGKVIAIGGSTKLEEMDAEKAVALAKAADVDVVILGTVLDAKSEESSKTGWLPPIAGQSVNVSVRSVKASVTLQGDLYRVSDGNKVTSLRVPGSHSDNKFSGGAYTTLGAWDGNSSAFLESPLGKALQAAIEAMVKKIAATKM